MGTDTGDSGTVSFGDCDSATVALVLGTDTGDNATLAVGN